MGATGAPGATGPAGQAAVLRKTVINIPEGTAFSWRGNFVDLDVTSLSNLCASFGSAPDTAENDFEDLAELGLAVTPGTGVINVAINSPGPFSGPIPINYLVG